MNGWTFGLALAAFVNVLIIDVVLVVAVRTTFRARAQMRKAAVGMMGIFHLTDAQKQDASRYASDLTEEHIIKGEK